MMPNLLLQTYIERDTSCHNAQELKVWQLLRIREQVAYAKKSCRFYAKHFCDVSPECIRSFSDFSQLPFTNSHHLRDHSDDLLCCPAKDIERVVTLKTSGTTGKRKRVFFTANDLMQTKEFFTFGMGNMASAGDRIAVLMPCEQDGSVGAILKCALEALGAEVPVCGPISNLEQCYRTLVSATCTGLVAIPTQALALAAYADLHKTRSGTIPLRFILLSADDIPLSLIRHVKQSLHCDCYQHYGLTETGFGCAVDCSRHCGGHIRENDLYVEIVDPKSGVLVPNGTVGEITITTLRRDAMPFIRYRTGDLGYIECGTCSCGSFLTRLIPQGGRLEDRYCGLSLAVLNELLFSLPEIVDFTVSVKSNVLYLTVYGLEMPDTSKTSELLLPYMQHYNLKLAVKADIINSIYATGMKKRHLLHDN